MVKASEEPWVGSWRPHRPRGPIAALYGSPGPKYALPGLTGSCIHESTYSKAPMFSFGKRPKDATTACSPGPSYLIPSNITKQGKGGTPAFSLSSRPKEPECSKGPGPGHYSPECSGKSIFHSAPAFSLSGRSKDGYSNQTPGPATYNLPPILGNKSGATSSAPSYSLYGRSKNGSFHEDLKKTPGPATYKVVDPSIYREKAPGYSMTGRNFAPGESSQKPGPGAHHPEMVTITKAKAPSFSFGLHHSQYMAPFIQNVED